MLTYRRITSICNDVHSEYCTSTSFDHPPDAKTLGTLLDLQGTSKLATKEDARTQLANIGMACGSAIKNKQVLRVKRHQDLSAVHSFHEGFTYLQSFLGNIMSANPGSLVNLQGINFRADNGDLSIVQQRFHRLYFILSSDIKIAHVCKPVISFDGGALKAIGWSNYQVLVCGMQDGENRDCSIGLAIVPTESEESYNYFIEGMKTSDILKGVLEQPELVVITDRAKGLMAAIKTSLPNAHHRYCNVHLLGNLPNPPLTPHQRSLYWNMVYCKSEDVFWRSMEELRLGHSLAAEYLEGLDASLWTDWKSPFPTWGHHSNNLAERAVKFIGTDANNGRRECPLTILQSYTNEVILESLITIFRLIDETILSATASS